MGQHIKGAVGFCAQTLHMVDDERFGEEVNRQISNVIADIMARPMDGDGKPTKARKVLIAFEFAPILAIDPQTKVPYLRAIDAVGHVDNKRPKTTGRKIDLRVIEGKVLWRPNSQDEFGQLSLFGEDEVHAEVGDGDPDDDEDDFDDDED